MANFIGYRPEEVDTLMNQIATSFKSVGEKMSAPWPNIVKTMQDNWHGVDEQNYEEILAKRVCDLYTATQEMVTKALDNIYGLGQSWVEFQNKNVQGSTSGFTSTASFTKPTIEAFDLSTVVKRQDNPFSGVDLGVMVGGDKTIISAMDNYKNEVTKSVSSIFNAIQSNKAFLGDQSKAIDTYIQAVGNSIAAFATNITELEDKVSSVAQQQYSDSSNTVSQNMNSAASAANTGDTTPGK